MRNWLANEEMPKGVSTTFISYVVFLLQVFAVVLIAAANLPVP